MAVAIVTGAGGLIGSTAVERLIEEGYDVIGVDNDMRAQFFGPEASTAPVAQALDERYPDLRMLGLDIRDREGIDGLIASEAGSLEIVLHAAAQPSHDWAARDPHTDFSVNAVGTLNLLQSCRDHVPDARFIFLSTNKVYGDRPNYLPLVETEDRLELPDEHEYFGGIDTTMSIDGCLHSVFGASKTAADVMVQEYGRYFEMPTVCFRGGCLTGPNHAGAQLHGFLAYLMKCAVTGTPYTVFGYGGKQVRDNIHSADLVDACLAFARSPRSGAVYNIGGGRGNDCSVIEAIAMCERISGNEMDWTVVDQNRIGDHRWWVSDLDEFRRDYPEWDIRIDLETTLQEIYERNVEAWTAAPAS